MSALDVIHQRAQQNLQRTVGLAAAGLLFGIPLERTGEVRAAYADASARIIGAGQRQAARLAAAYIAAYAQPQEDVDLAGALEGTLTTPEDATALVGLLRLWSLLDDGAGELDAREQAGQYASNLAEGDVMAAKRAGLDEAAEATGRRARWALIPADGACEWCQEIADGGYRYSDAETVPRHTHGPCNCSPGPEFEE